MKNLTIFIICGLLIWHCSDSGTNNNDPDPNPDKTYDIDYNIILYGGTTDSIGFNYKLRDYNGDYVINSYLLEGPYLPDNPFRWGWGYSGSFKGGDSLYFEVEVFPYCSGATCTWSGRVVIEVDDEEYKQASIGNIFTTIVVLEGCL